MSFHSDPEMRDDLRKPFPPQQISKLPGTAKRPALDYVSHAAVTDRLNHAAPDWTYSLEPVVTEKDGMPHVIAVFGHMTIGGVSRPEVGAVDSPSSYGQELKEAISDFIRRGAMRFGVALDLWAKEDLAPVEAPLAGSKAGAIRHAPKGASDRVQVPGAGDSAPAASTSSLAGEDKKSAGRAAERGAGHVDPAASPPASLAGEDKNQGTAPAETSGEEGKATGEGVNPSSSGYATDQQWAKALTMFGESKANVLKAHAAKFGKSVKAADITEGEMAELLAG